MSDHERYCRALFLSQPQELSGEIDTHIVIRHKVRSPEAIQDREQEQRIVGRLSERFSFFN